MESIVQIRQMMAEQKFFDAQKLIEVQLSLKADSRHELLELYFEALTAQRKSFPLELALELAEYESQKKNHDLVMLLIDDIKHEKYFSQVMRLKIRAAEDKGMMEELYRLLSLYIVRQFEKQVPFVPEWTVAFIEKYFKHDFQIKLKLLAINLLLNNVEKCETLVKELIVSTVERSSPKGITAKLVSIGEVLRSGSNKAQLEIYQNFCFIYAQGISDKADYKRIVEMVIYFEDFRFQVLVLNLMVRLQLEAEANDFAETVRSNKDYNFVYFDKFFPHLKRFFVSLKSKQTEKKEEPPVPDLKLSEKYKSEFFVSDVEVDETEDEGQYIHLLKYQSYTPDQLCDLAVSFLQSEMPKVALKAAELAMKSAIDDKTYLKGSYLRLTCQLQLKDYRAALDTCLEALTRATSKDDILSFLYGQADIYIRLNRRTDAKKILSKILSIDSKYRLAKERLDKLNEI